MIVFLFFIATTEDVVFKTEQEIDLELIVGDLEYLRNHPVDINSAGIDQFTRIPYLSSNEIMRIIEYRNRYGSFGSVEELINVPGIDPSLLQLLRPFITIGVKRFEIEALDSRLRVRTALPGEERSVEYYTRTRARMAEYGINVITERDPYEDDFFDHNAVGLLIYEGKRKFAMGKYNLDLGAGAVLSPVGSFFRGIEFRVMLNERRLIPYTSTIENGGFFGAAFADSFFVDYTLFYSNQKLDGTVDSLGFARSLDGSGEHTDSASSSRKDRINEEILGYDIRYRKADVLVASRSYFCSYEPSFVTSDSVARFYGDDFFLTGLEFRYLGEEFIFFSEVVRSWKNSIGGLFGFSAVFPFVDFNLAGKYFPRGFYSPKGIEAAANHASGTLDITHHSSIIDAGFSLTLDNRLDEDTTKHDLKFSLAKRLGRLDARINFRRRYRAEDVDLSGSEVLLRFKATRFLFLDLRFEEKSLYKEETERGIFLAVELGLDLKRLDARVRYGIFDTDTYAARIYAYEIDLQGIVNNRMLYGDGEYGFVYLSMRPVQQIKLSMKYAVVNRDSISDKKIGGQIDFNL
ncbi:MAG: helix-hairpin-helix domain-containing protein [candidate division WOR-3 bacterium]|nr:MAG: helix-hairpin-helix domain-containing protein [candidate division WOR-3 bacterium]